MTYSGTASVIGGFISGGSASVVGIQTPTGAGMTSGFSFLDSQLSGVCTDLGFVFCGITFSPLTDANFLVNGETRHFSQTLNLTAVPEPSTAMLVAAGLACLARRRQPMDRVR